MGPAVRAASSCRSAAAEVYRPTATSEAISAAASPGVSVTGQAGRARAPARKPGWPTEGTLLLCAATSIPGRPPAGEREARQ